MTIPEAAAIIMHAERVDRSTAMTWAWQSFREAQAQAEAKRQAYFEERRQELKKARWLERVRSAPIITPARHAARDAREGGWTIEFLPPDEPNQEEAA